MDASATINFHQTRDFSRKMSVTFEFVRENFRSLGKSIMVIAGPPVLVASVMMGSFIGDFFGASMSAAGNPEAFQNLVTSVNFWLQIGLAIVFMLLSSVLTIATINNYMLLYDQLRTTRIEVEAVWQKVRDTFWMYLGTGFLLTVMIVAAYIVMVIVIALLAAASPFLIFFGVVGVICGLFYLIVGCSLVFIIRGYERVGFFEAITRSFKLIQGKWWSTFGLIMVLYLIVGTVSYIFIIPWYVFTLVSTLHDVESGVVSQPSTGYQIMTIVFFTLYYLVQMILYALPNVGVAFQYFNLVERKEARGLMNQIENFGQSAPTTTRAPDEHY
jgi:hypothetical protein